MTDNSILWFDTIGIGDVTSVGGKNTSLGEMVRTLSARVVRVPDGFATNAEAYRSFVAAHGIEAAIRAQLAAYQAALRAGASIVQASLMDFLR